MPTPLAEFPLFERVTLLPDTLFNITTLYSSQRNDHVYDGSSRAGRDAAQSMSVIGCVCGQCTGPGRRLHGDHAAVMGCM